MSTSTQPPHPPRGSRLTKDGLCRFVIDRYTKEIEFIRAVALYYTPLPDSQPEDESTPLAQNGHLDIYSLNFVDFSSEGIVLLFEDGINGMYIQINPEAITQLKQIQDYINTPNDQKSNQPQEYEVDLRARRFEPYSFSD